MVLSAHAITGAALASVLPNNPVLAFVAGFMSHFFLDAIPHRDYAIGSLDTSDLDPIGGRLRINARFARDLIKIGFDFLFGLSVSAVVFSSGLAMLPVILLGAFAGMLPDGLQFVYMTTKSRVLIPLQRFHRFVHVPNELPVSQFSGLLIQAVFSTGVIIATLGLLS